MPRAGKILRGCSTVLIEGQSAARATDLTDHAGLIGEGCPTVLVGAGARPAARVGDRYVCPIYEDSAHVGGFVMAGAGTVLVSGKPAARMGDAILCVGEAAAGTQFVGLGQGPSGLDASAAAACRALWEKYDAEARAIIAPAGDDHRKRNHILNGAYAKLYLDNKSLKWAGLAAYASKQVGCAMDHAQRMAKSKPWAKDVADYTYDQLGNGNRSLFLDIYPLHRFFHEQGFDKLNECAGERRPPVPAAALDGFAALDMYNKTGDPKYAKEHVRAIAWHEQVNILQRDIYNDKAMQRILDANEGNFRLPDISKAAQAGLNADTGKDVHEDDFDIGFDPRGRLQPLHERGGAKPADVVMTDQCEDPGGKATIPFKANGRRGHVYDIDERMDWILNDIGGYYLGVEGTRAHLDHLGKLTTKGASEGGNYP